MKIKINTARTLPRDYKVHGWNVETWEKLNEGEVVEVDSIPSGYNGLVTEVEGDTSSRVEIKSPIKKKGAK